MMPSLQIKPGPHWWDESAPTTALLFLPETHLLWVLLYMYLNAELKRPTLYKHLLVASSKNHEFLVKSLEL